MREIKFRARAIQDFETSADRVEKGDWVYGHYYFCRRRMTGVIVTTLEVESGGVGSGVVQAHVEADPETVGQYTNFKDQSGVEIFEGDIGKRTRIVGSWGPVYDYWEVVFHEGSFVTRQLNSEIIPYLQIFDEVEVIGNIYQHPELLN